MITLCLTAPYFQQWSFFLPIVTHGSRKERTISLTFDDGPDPETTEALLGILSKYNVKATFFVIGRLVENYPDLIKKIIEQGHEIGNHSQTHDSILMMRRSSTLLKEIETCQESLRTFGVRPCAFRPPVGITNPRLLKVLLKLGMFCVGFSCRPVDFGNRKIRKMKEKVLKSIKPGDIVMLHDRKPGKATVKQWLSEVEGIVAGMTQKNLRIISLSDLTKRPVMEVIPATDSKTQNPMENFFNPIIKNTESKNAQTITRLLKLCKKQHRVLEVFSGLWEITGPVSKHVKHLVATTPSRRVAEQLSKNTRTERIHNIKPFQGSISDLDSELEFDLIYSFLSFNYMDDLKSLIQSLQKHQKDNGILFFVLPKLTIHHVIQQFSNGLTKGIWLKGWRSRTVRKYLSDSGYSIITLSSHPDSQNNGTNLQIIARKKAC